MWGGGGGGMGCYVVGSGGGGSVWGVGVLEISTHPYQGLKLHKEGENVTYATILGVLNLVLMSSHPSLDSPPFGISPNFIMRGTC